MSVTIKPREAHFKPNGIGIASVRMENQTEVPLAVKVLCTDNGIFRVKPVYALLGPKAGTNLDVARLAAPPRIEDKLVVHSLPWPDAAAGTPTPDIIASFFRSAPGSPCITRVNLIATEAEPRADVARAFPLPDADLSAFAQPLAN